MEFLFNGEPIAELTKTIEPGMGNKSNWFKTFKSKEEFDLELSYYKELSDIPGIVPVLSVGMLEIFEAGTLVRKAFAIRFPTLKKSLEQAARETLVPEALLPIMISVADTLSVLEERRILHNDLKPKHIFLTEDNRPIIIDLGIASRIGAPSDERSRKVTMPYGDPQKSVDNTVKVSTDIYSFGMILAELKNKGEGQHIVYPGAFIDVAKKCVGENRYESFTQVCQDLKMALQSLEQEKNMIETIPHDCKKWHSLLKNSIRKAVVAVIYLVAAFFFAVGIYMRNRPLEKEPLRPEGAPNIITDCKIIYADIKSRITSLSL